MSLSCSHHLLPSNPDPNRQEKRPNQKTKDPEKNRKNTLKQHGTVRNGDASRRPNRTMQTGGGELRIEGEIGEAAVGGDGETRRLLGPRSGGRIYSCHRTS